MSLLCAIDLSDSWEGTIMIYVFFRFSDFIVHEIDLDGNIVKLTNLEAPEESRYTCLLLLL